MSKAIEIDIDAERFNPIYLERLLHNQNRVQIYYGGSSSGKSYSIAQRVVLDILGGKRNYLVVRNVQVTLRDSCFNEIIKILVDWQLADYFSINKSNLEITCNLTRKQILFKGLDDPEKIKSVTPADGPLTDIWIEEATEIDRSAYKQLAKRLRGISEVKKRITLSFNPILRTHWLYEEFFSIWDDSQQYVEADGVSILKTTYKDNRFLEADDIAGLENESDSYYFEVYTLGNWGVLGNVIFRNWRVEEFDEIEATFAEYRNGADWGFGSDPFAFARCHYDRTRNKLYIISEIYAVGLLNAESAVFVRDIIGPNDIVVCDSAEPKSIAEYQQFGINAIGAIKGKGSIEHGIKFLQGLDIIIHPRCQHARNEFSQYKYKEDRLGNSLPVPVDKNNHLIDAIRYATEDAYLNTQYTFISASAARATGTTKRTI